MLSKRVDQCRFNRTARVVVLREGFAYREELGTVDGFAATTQGGGGALTTLQFLIGNLLHAPPCVQRGDRIVLADGREVVPGQLLRRPSLLMRQIAGEILDLEATGSP